MLTNLSSRAFILAAGISALSIIIAIVFWPSRQSEVSETPVFSLKRHCLDGSIECDATEAIPLAKSIISKSWQQPTSGVILHVMRMDSPLKAIGAREFAEPILEFENIMLHDENRHSIGGGIPILLDSPYGAQIRTSKSNGPDAVFDFDAVAHDDQLIAIFFEAGRDLNTPITTPSGNQLSVKEILNSSVCTFSLGRELEWTVVAYCGYLDDLRFENEFNKFDVLDLIRALNHGVANGDGACHGIHRLSALAICRQRLLYDVSRGVSSAREAELRKVIEEIEANFRHVSKLLLLTQSTSGYWDEHWSDPKAKIDETSMVTTKDQLAARARATGHLVEWLNLIEPEFWPSAPSVERAISYLTSNVTSNPDFYGNKLSLVSSHVVTAIINITSEKPTE
jgi:hypothetical protein